MRTRESRAARSALNAAPEDRHKLGNVLSRIGELRDALLEKVRQHEAQISKNTWLLSGWKLILRSCSALICATPIRSLRTK